MPTSFQFNSTQLAEIKRLRDIATRPENKQALGGGADLYRYIFKAVTGIDVTQKHAEHPYRHGMAGQWQRSYAR